MPTISDSDISSKGAAVRDKAVEKWMEMEAGFAFPEMEGAVQDAFAYIVPLFEMYSHRDPDRVDAMRDYLADTRTTLANPVSEGIDTAKGQIEDWRGAAAENFWGDYLEPFPQINTNQLAFIDVLDASLQGVKSMLEESRKNIVDIGDNTIDALDGLEDGGGGWGLALTVVAVVVGVVGAAFTGGTSAVAAVSFALASGAASIGASVAAMEEQEIHGEDVEEVVNSMVEAHNDLWEMRNTVEEDLAELIGQDVDMTQSNPDYFRPPIPDIASFGASDAGNQEILEDFEPPA
ncbi:MAG: hypothetical protein ACRDXX_07300 [Stackebrandtia sp.]